MRNRFLHVQGDANQIGEAEQPEALVFWCPQVEQHQITAALSQASLQGRERADRRAGQRVQRRTVQDQSKVTGLHHSVAAIPEPADVGGIDPAAEMQHRAVVDLAAVDTAERVKLEPEALLPDIQTFGWLPGPGLGVVTRHGPESIAAAPESGQFREVGRRGRMECYWNLIALASTVRRSPGCTLVSRTARSMTLRSSRTLPGQWCSPSFAIARGVRRR